MPTYKVTTLIQDYQVYEVRAKNWKAAKKLVEEGGGIYITHHPDDGSEEVIFIDAADGSKVYWERELP